MRAIVIRNKHERRANVNRNSHNHVKAVRGRALPKISFTAKGSPRTPLPKGLTYRSLQNWDCLDTPPSVWDTRRVVEELDIQVFLTLVETQKNLFLANTFFGKSFTNC